MSDVRIVGPDERSGNTGQTPGGLHRFEAISNKLDDVREAKAGDFVFIPAWHRALGAGCE